jgi:hypothetical protein
VRLDKANPATVEADGLAERFIDSDTGGQLSSQLQRIGAPL